MGNKIIFPVPERSYSASTYQSLMMYIPNPTSGAQIPCLYIHHPGKPRNNLAIYFHGNSEDLGSCFTFCYSIFEKMNVDVLVMEYKGYGIYTGEPSEESILSDSEAVLSYLLHNWRAYGYKQENILLIGRSLGTGVACFLASRYNDTQRSYMQASATRNLAGVILISPFTSIRGVGEEKAGFLLSKILPNIFDNLSRMSYIQCPILFVHGCLDGIVPSSHSEMLHARCGSYYKKLCLHKQLDHNGFDFMKDLLPPIKDFFHRLRPELFALPQARQAATKREDLGPPNELPRKEPLKEKRVTHQLTDDIDDWVPKEVKVGRRSMPGLFDIPPPIRNTQAVGDAPPRKAGSPQAQSSKPPLLPGPLAPASRPQSSMLTSQQYVHTHQKENAYDTDRITTATRETCQAIGMPYSKAPPAHLGRYRDPREQFAVQPPRMQTAQLQYR